MDYSSIDADKAASGLRLVLNAGVPGAWALVSRALEDYDSALIEQRDLIFANHLALPLDF